MLCILTFPTQRLKCMGVIVLTNYITMTRDVFYAMSKLTRTHTTWFFTHSQNFLLLMMRFKTSSKIIQCFLCEIMLQ
jgi:hypothetical protein